MPGEKENKETQVDDQEIEASADDLGAPKPDDLVDHNAGMGKDQNLDQAAGAALEKSEGGRKRQNQGPESLKEFLKYAYKRDGQRLAIAIPTQKRIANATELSEKERDELLLLAAEDQRLAVAPQLLLTILFIDAYPVLKNSIRDFAGEVLSRHPIFRAKGLVDVLRNLPNASSEDEAVQAITSLNRTELKEIGISEDLSGPKASGIRRNALNALLLWFMVARGRSVDTLIRRGFTEIWGPAADRVRGDGEQARKLLMIKDPSALGLVGRFFQRRVDMADKKVGNQERLQRKLSLQVQEIANERDTLQKEVVDLKRTLSEVRAELANLRRQSESDQIHQQDAYEQLRGRMLGRLKREAELLEEGLHALRQSKPRVSVMDDHAERVLERIREEIRRMVSGNGQ